MADRITDFGFLTPTNKRIWDLTNKLDFDDLRPVLLRCKTRILMVADGTLDFSPTRGFGMGVFADTILDMILPARVELTLAHMRSGRNLLDGDARVMNRIHQFKFDDPAHFGTNMYDSVFVFGIDTNFSGRPSGYNGSQLTPDELQALAEYMNSGGGLFATGDHADLGRAMGHMIPRAGKMRLWDSTSSDNELDEVSMDGPRRNDTNRLGDAGSQFDDQSDDIPQDISPRMYTKNTAIFRYSFPHPLLCGPNGPIRVMPDHPHEGECIEPTETNDDIDFLSNLGPEFPPAIDGGPRPLPEVISTNTVPSGNISTSAFFGDKDPTEAHSFGGICAYDGHRANVGRVVTDATWHHFVNINLTGDPAISDGSVKDFGFLASPQGQAHFEEIKTYYRNLAIWLTRRSIVRCMNRGWVFELVRNARIVEAITSATAVGLPKTNVRVLLLIGEHAKDVIGKFAGQCQTRRLQCWILKRVPKAPEFEHFFREFDPWNPTEPKEADRDVERNLGFGDMSPVFDIALGAALVEANRFLDKNDEKFDTEELDAVLVKGAEAGLKIGMQAMSRSQEELIRATRAFQ
jgi:hypothetical protein